MRDDVALPAKGLRVRGCRRWACSPVSGAVALLVGRPQRGPPTPADCCRLGRVRAAPRRDHPGSRVQPWPGGRRRRPGHASGLRWDARRAQRPARPAPDRGHRDRDPRGAGPGDRDRRAGRLDDQVDRRAGRRGRHGRLHRAAHQLRAVLHRGGDAIEAVPGIALVSRIRQVPAIVDGAEATVTGVEPETIGQVQTLGMEAAALASGGIVVDIETAATAGRRDRGHDRGHVGQRARRTPWSSSSSTRARRRSPDGRSRWRRWRPPGCRRSTRSCTRRWSRTPTSWRCGPSSTRSRPPYPTVQILDQTEFKETISGQINQLLSLVYALLGPERDHRHLRRRSTPWPCRSSSAPARSGCCAPSGCCARRSAR